MSNPFLALLNRLDVAAAALNRFRQQTSVPAAELDRATLTRLWGERNAVMGEFWPAGVTPQAGAAALADEAVAALAVSEQLGLGEPAVRAVQSWLVRVCWLHAPIPSGWLEYACDRPEIVRKYTAEGDLLAEYLAVRERLLAAAAHLGFVIARDIRHRAPLDGSATVSDATFRAWLGTETMPTADSAAIDVPLRSAEDEGGDRSSKPPRHKDRPGRDREADILAVIEDKRMPLQRAEIMSALRMPSEGRLGKQLAALVADGVLVNIPNRGYWFADRSEPV